MRITEQQLIRAIYSLWDFQQALSALTFLLEDCDFNEKYNMVSLRRFRCYESNLIISLARPFESTRGGTTIGLRALGITLSHSEKMLVERMLDLRRKIVAHSAEEEMIFRASTFPVLEGEINIPQFQFHERLHLEELELRELEVFLRRLQHEMSKFFFQMAQNQPELLERYRNPDLFKKSADGNT